MLNAQSLNASYGRVRALKDLSLTVSEGEIVAVLVSIGAQVQEDDPILEVETDKAAVEITSPFAGTVTAIRVEPGDMVNVGDVLITFDGGAGPDEQPREASKTRRGEERADSPADPLDLDRGPT